MIQDELFFFFWQEKKSNISKNITVVSRSNMVNKVWEWHKAPDKRRKGKDVIKALEWKSYVSI